MFLRATHGATAPIRPGRSHGRRAGHGTTGLRLGGSARPDALIALRSLHRRPGQHLTDKAATVVPQRGPRGGRKLHSGVDHGMVEAPESGRVVTTHGLKPAPVTVVQPLSGCVGVSDGGGSGDGSSVASSGSRL